MPSPLSRRRLLCLVGGGLAATGSTLALAGYAQQEALTATGLRSQVQGVVTGPLHVAAWGTAMVAPDRGSRAWSGFPGATLRMVVRTSVGGSHLRVRLSNRFGRTPLRVGAATLALRLDGPLPRPDTLRPLLFGGAREAVVAVGEELVSDPVELPVAAGDALLVSLYLPGPGGPATWHPRTQDATFVSGAGDFTAARSARWFPEREVGWFYLTGLELVSTTATGTVVCFGDSITDGAAPRTDITGDRWPDHLAARIAAARADRPLAVVDAGIAGNRLLTDRPGPGGGAGRGRFGRDVLAQPGVTDVIVLEGINDISHGRNGFGGPLTATDLIEGLQDVIAQARSAGVAVHGGTLLPFRGATVYREDRNAVREQVNRWIRTSGAFDSVIDFERAVRDPGDPLRYRPEYDSGDHLHPAAPGYAAMAEAVDLRTLHG